MNQNETIICESGTYLGFLLHASYSFLQQSVKVLLFHALIKLTTFGNLVKRLVGDFSQASSLLATFHILLSIFLQTSTEELQKM